MLLKDEKTAVIEANRTHENDTGSPEVESTTLLNISSLTRTIITQEEVFSRWLVTDVISSAISRRRISTDIVLSLRSSVFVSNFINLKAVGVIPFCL